MKVAGFTFIRNAVKFDYPIVEAIQSILPICDEFIVAVGQSEDDTLQLIQAIENPKIRIIETVWDDSLREGGRVLAAETDKAFQAISADTDWCFYIQGDECVHEKYLPSIKKGMEDHLQNHKVEGLLFDYLHFYGSYDYVGTSKRWYRHEIRVVRNLKEMKSYRDAQGFRISNRKLNVKSINASIYHYGWVKHPGKQQEKAKSFNKYWHDDRWMEQNIPDVSEFDYSNVDGLKKFLGSHPKVMQNRINNINWKFTFDPTQKKISMKYRFVEFVERIFGYRIGEYKNYRKI
jgi:ribosomal protein S18